MKPYLMTSSLLALLCAGTAPAWAQDSQSQAHDQQPDAQPAQGGEAGDIIVTGRAGTGQRTKAEMSYSVTRIDEEALRLQAPTSVTEALKSVPGFWVESSGG